MRLGLGEVGGERDLIVEPCEASDAEITNLGPFILVDMDMLICLDRNE